MIKLGIHIKNTLILSEKDKDLTLEDKFAFTASIGNSRCLSSKNGRRCKYNEGWPIYFMFCIYDAKFAIKAAICQLVDPETKLVSRVNDNRTEVQKFYVRLNDPDIKEFVSKKNTNNNAPVNVESNPPSFYKPPNPAEKDIIEISSNVRMGNDATLKISKITPVLRVRSPQPQDNSEYTDDLGIKITTAPMEGKVNFLNPFHLLGTGFEKLVPPFIIFGKSMSEKYFLQNPTNVGNAIFGFAPISEIEKEVMLYFVVGEDMVLKKFRKYKYIL